MRSSLGKEFQRSRRRACFSRLIGKRKAFQRARQRDEERGAKGKDGEALTPSIEHALGFYSKNVASLEALVPLPDGLRERQVARAKIQLDLFRRPENAGSMVVEFSFPARDYNCGEAIADQVHAGATHIH